MVIWKVFPAFDTEFVSILNCGEEDVDLLNWSLSDGEGEVRVHDRLVLERNSSLSFCTNTTLFSQITDVRPVIALDNSSLKIEGRFILANEGDEVVLRDGSEVLVDAFIYGDSEYQDEGWSGTPFPKIPRGEMAERSGTNGSLVDSNSSQDWCLSVPGRTDAVPVTCNALVEPFSFPENGKERLLRELDYASRSVLISMYKLSDEDVLHSLMECSERGVEVRILLEGSPVGGFSDTYEEGLQSLIDSGCTVHLFRSWEGFKRYDYLHCKIAVIDDSRCTVTSENWVTESFDYNRGWGVTIESRGLASYFTAIVEDDLDVGSLDSEGYKERVDPASSFKSDESEKVVPVSTRRRLPAEVSTVVSPDFSREVISNLINSADRRILIEEFYCDPSWLNSSGLLFDLLEAAKRGVEVKLLLDSTWFNLVDSKNNRLVADTINGWGESYGVNIESRLVSDYHPFRMLHNKGMIVDDRVLISSINWCNASLDENREFGVSIRSRTVASFYTDLFRQDWMEDPAPPELEFEFSNDLSDGGLVWLDASNSTDNQGISNYLWDLGADGSIDWVGPQHLVSLPSGRHTILLSVVDRSNNTAEKTFQVRVRETGETPGYLMYAPAVLLGSVITFWQVRKKIKSS